MQKIIDQIKGYFQMGFLPLLQFFSRWLLISAWIGLLAGTASALFLVALAYVTDYRENHLFLIALLPLGGFTDRLDLPPIWGVSSERK
jgi:hypothetical protein